MCQKYSAFFIIIIVFASVGLFTITLLNMIFSIKTYKTDVFEYPTVEEYREILKRTFIMDLEFGEDLDKNDIFGEYWRDPVNKWRNTSMKIKRKKFEIEILKDVIWKEDNCRLGYKKCGLVNSNDSLCLKLGENEACPINKIFIDNNETFGNCKTFKLGEKYIHFSNEEIDDYFFMRFNITDRSLKTTLDKDSFENLHKYNPDVWNYYGTAYLNAEYFSLQNKENFEKLIEDYKIITEIYNRETIDDMNEKMGNKTIMALGIIIFVLTTFFIIDIGLYFAFKNQKDGDCLKNADFSKGVSASQNPCGAVCGLLIAMICLATFWCFFRYSCEPCLGRELNQKKLSIALLLIFFPELILAVLSMVFAFMKKNKIDDYLSMEYIDMFQNESVKSVQDSLDRVIILIIVNIAIFVLYPILVLIANKLKGDDDYGTVKNNIETSLSEYNQY